MGGSKKQTVGYEYYLGMHMVLCHGPIDYITRIQVDKRTAWEGVKTGGSITINARQLFGGGEREGGIAGKVDFEMGGPAQGVNSYLQAQLGAIIPAFRGVVSVVLNHCYLGNNPYLKAWSFRGTRVLLTTDGEVQWYPSKAAIQKETEPLPPPINYEIATYISGALNGGVGYPAIGEDLADTLTIGPFDEPREIQSIAARASDRFVFNDEVYGTIDDFIYPNGTVFYTLQPGETVTVKVRNMSNTPICAAYGFFSAVAIAGPQPDMNPAHIIRECLTNQDWGMGYLASDVDDESFTAAADLFYSEGLGLSMLWDRQIVIEEFIKEVARHVDTALYVSRTTGKFVLKPIRADYDVETLLVLDESNIVKVSNPNRPTFGELSNSITVKFWNYKTGEEDAVSVEDPAMAVMQGGPIGTVVQYPGFTTHRNATLAAQRDLKSLSSTALSCTIYANQDAKVLNIGDTFKFTWSRWKVENLVMRVNGIAFGDGKNKQVRITCAQDIYSTPTQTLVGNSPTAWVDPVLPPAPADKQLAVEAPYYELVQQYGQTAVDSLIASNVDMGYVLAAAGRAGSAVNARVWVDAGAGYEDSAPLDYCPTAELASAISPDQTLIDYLDGVDLDQVVLGTFLQIEDEICRIDSIDTDLLQMTIGRGCLDTTPRLHLAGSLLFFWDQYSGTDPTEYVNGEVLDVKVLPTGVGITDAIPMTVEMVARPWLPYPPGQLKINGEYYPEGPLDGSVVVTWVHRDRLQQTSGEVYDHTFGSIGPEAGTTYRFQGFIDGVLDETISPATSGMTWTPSSDGLARIEVHALRDGVYSYQPAMHEFYHTSTNLRAFEEGDTLETQDADVRVTEE